MESLNDILKSISLEKLNIKDLALLVEILDSIKTNEDVEVI